MGKTDIKKLIRRIGRIARWEGKAAKTAACVRYGRVDERCCHDDLDSCLLADDGLDRSSRHQLLVFNQLGVLVHDGVEHPASIHSHALREVVQVADDLRLQGDTCIKTS